MPLKSCSDLVLDERSPSCSSQSSATETYSVPLGTSTEIDFKYDDEQVANILEKIPLPKQNGGNVTTVIGSNNTVGAKVNIGVDAETTTININHYHPKPDPDEVDDDEPKNNAPANKPTPTSHPKRGLEILKRHYKFLIVVITSITLVCAIALITLQFTAKKQVEPITSTTTAGTTRTPHPIHYIFNKTQWGGRASTKQIPIEVPINLLIIKHTNTSTCQDVSSCFSAMQQLQNTDVGEHELPDIRYNFVIGGDGNIYVGRGWQVQNEQMNNTIDVAYLGNFNEDIPSEFMVGAGPWLMVKGALEGFVDESTVRIVCHNQTEVTDSPGKNLYREVVKWKYYSDEII